jgi:hypothetical protein
MDQPAMTGQAKLSSWALPPLIQPTHRSRSQDAAPTFRVPIDRAALSGPQRRLGHLGRTPRKCGRAGSATRLAP